MQNLTRASRELFRRTPDETLPLPDPATLPDDPEVLRQLVVQLLEALQKERQDRQRLEHHLDLLLRRLYGRSSEKFDRRQGLLFELPAGEADAEEPSPVPAAPSRSSHGASANRHAHGRGRVPDTVQREEVVHDLTDAEKAVFGGAENLELIGEERSEQLDWRPSTLFVTVHVRKKYPRRPQLPESGDKPDAPDILAPRNWTTTLGRNPGRIGPVLGGEHGSETATDRGGSEGQGSVGGGAGRSHNKRTGVSVRPAFHPDRPMEAATAGRCGGTVFR